VGRWAARSAAHLASLAFISCGPVTPRERCRRGPLQRQLDSWIFGLVLISQLIDLVPDHSASRVAARLHRVLTQKLCVSTRAPHPRVRQGQKKGNAQERVTPSRVVGFGRNHDAGGAPTPASPALARSARAPPWCGGPILSFQNTNSVILYLLTEQDPDGGTAGCWAPGRCCVLDGRRGLLGSAGSAHPGWQGGSALWARARRGRSPAGAGGARAARTTEGRAARRRSAVAGRRCRRGWWVGQSLPGSPALARSARSPQGAEPPIVVVPCIQHIVGAEFAFSAPTMR